jgi:Cys-rich repeat protein
MFRTGERTFVTRMRPSSRSAFSLVAVAVAVSVVVSASCSSPNEISLLGGSPDARAPGSAGGAAGGGGFGGDVGLTKDAAPGCRTAADCTPIAPFCDAKSGACLECVTDSNCPTYLCDPVAHVCKGCTKATDCHAATPYCDDDDHRCIQCRSLADCAVGEACVAEAHACATRCLGPGDCAGSNRQICAAAAGVCVECTSNADCVSGNRPPFCDLRIGSCVECLKDADCPTGRCTPIEPRCVP